jgi:nitrogen fixation protein NifZ
VHYHVHFPGKTLEVPESALDPAEPDHFKEPEN